MKKSRIAVGVIVALGVVWTGGAWYTGKKIETHMADMVQQANQKLKQIAPGGGLEISYQDYQRGMFSSHLRVVIKPVTGAKIPCLEPGQSMVLDETIEHGPFPLTSLMSFNLLPSMAWVKTTLVNNELTKPLFDIAKGESPFGIINTRISYNSEAHSTINLKPLESKSVASSGGTFQLDVGQQGKSVSLTGGLESGRFNIINDYNQEIKVTLSNLKINNSSELASFDEWIGHQKLTLDKLAIAIAEKDLTELEGMDLDNKDLLSNDGKAINSQLDVTLNSLKLQNQNMGSGKLTLKIDQVDGQAWHQFHQLLNTSQSLALLTQPDGMQKLSTAFFNLLKSEPVVTIAPLSWKNAKGESVFNFALSLKDLSKTAKPAKTPSLQMVSNNVKSLDSKLVIPMDMATELMTQVAQLGGVSPNDAEKLAAQQVKSWAAMGQMFHITTTQDNNVTTSLNYANEQVTLNEQKMSLEEFADMFGALVR